MSRSPNDEAFKDSMRSPSPSPPITQRPSSPSPSKPPSAIPPASPSASILLISPLNKILLLHRVQTSTSFPSAHVFPGGHLSPQDGPLPPPSPQLHEDNLAYRRAAIRECFEESGLLLAKREGSIGGLVELGEREREEGRRAVHSESIPFQDWVQQRGGGIDVEGLVPFTRWLTPANIPKRFSTQMYLYFLPLNTPLDSRTDQSQSHIPTPDGGIEHTAARFLYPREWLDLALADSVVLFPPQFFLLSLIAPFLAPPSAADPADSTEQFFREQRQRLMRFVEEDGEPKWGEKCISPNPIKQVGRYLIMGMGDAGPEVEGWGRRGDGERVLRVEVGEDGDRDRGRRRMAPREVVWRRDVFGEEGGKL